MCEFILTPPATLGVGLLMADVVLFGGTGLTGFLNVGEGVVRSVVGGAFSDDDLDFLPARPAERCNERNYQSYGLMLNYMHM